MADLEKMFRKAVMTTIGAAAVVAEKGAEVVKTVADKGAEVLRDQEATDALAQKGRQFVNDLKDKGSDLYQKAKEACTTETFVINVADLDRKERAQLRRQLDEADKADAEAAKAAMEEMAGKVIHTAGKVFNTVADKVEEMVVKAANSMDTAEKPETEAKVPVIDVDAVVTEAPAETAAEAVEEAIEEAVAEAEETVTYDAGTDEVPDDGAEEPSYT